jgi:hypothetical protein
MDAVDYDVNGMTEEEYQAIERRVDEACARTDAILARHAEEKIAALANINVTLTREGEWIIAECNEDIIVSQGVTEAEAVGNLLEALQLRYDLTEAPKVKRITRLGELYQPAEASPETLWRRGDSNAGPRGYESLQRVCHLFTSFHIQLSLLRIAATRQCAY